MAKTNLQKGIELVEEKIKQHEECIGWNTISIKDFDFNEITNYWYKLCMEVGYAFEQRGYKVEIHNNPYSVNTDMHISWEVGDSAELKKLKGREFDYDDVVCCFTEQEDEVIISLVEKNVKYGNHICDFYNLYYNTKDSEIHRMWIDKETDIIVDAD